MAPLPPERKPGNDAVLRGLDQGMTGIRAPLRAFGNAVARATRTAAMPIALFEPDIPQNTGTILRLAACFGIAAHLIEPAGFPVSDRAFRRAGMDYLDAVKLVRHASWDAFDAWRRGQALRLMLFTTRATASYLDHRYETSDILLFGREFGGRAGPCPHGSRRAAARPDAAGLALAQRGDDLRHGGRRGAAADRGICGVRGWLKSVIECEVPMAPSGQHESVA